MPGQILRACAVCGRPFKPRHARHRHCPVHEQHGNAHRSPTTRMRPSSSTEREKLRGSVVGEGIPCAIQLPGCEGLATRMDHITPAAEGGSNDPSNLRPACDFCNSSLGGQIGSPAQGASGGAARSSDGGERDRPPGYTRLH